MFKDLLDKTNELETTSVATKDFLIEVRKNRQRIKRNIAKAEKDIAVIKNPDKYVKSLLPKIQKQVLKDAVDIVQGQILTAMRDNYEFDWPIYRRALFLAAANKDAYKVYNLGGSGWNTRFTFTIDLNVTAGRLEAWSRGVVLTRRALNVKIPRKGGGEKQQRKRELSALQASRAWGGIFSRRAAGAGDKFTSTIKSRLQNSGQVAPFWQLLDKGAVPMASDRGGYPTPKGQPTNFIQHSQEVMDEYTKNILKPYKENYDKLLADYNAAFEEIQEALARTDSLISEMELDLRSINKIKQAYGRDSKRMDDTKLANAVKLMRDGLLTAGRVELTREGRKRIRPSVRKLLMIGEITY